MSADSPPDAAGSGPGAPAWARRLPVQLTVARIALTPVVMALLLADDGLALRTTAAIVFAVSAITDWLDGRLARRWQVTSTLGGFLDTTADKLLVTGVLLALVADAHASPWVAAIIIGRELLILGLRAVVAVSGLVISPSWWGKAKTTVQFAALVLAILRPDVALGAVAAHTVALWLAAAITLVSAVDYLIKFRNEVPAAG